MSEINIIFAVLGSRLRHQIPSRSHLGTLLDHRRRRTTPSSANYPPILTNHRWSGWYESTYSRVVVGVQSLHYCKE